MCSSREFALRANSRLNAALDGNGSFGELPVKPYEELAVLEQGDDGAVVSIRGVEGPLVLLGPEYLGHLAALVAAAEKAVDSLKSGLAMEPVTALCAEMRTLLKTYDDTCAKFHGNRSLPRTAAQIEQELEDLRKQLDRF